MLSGHCSFSQELSVKKNPNQWPEDLAALDAMLKETSPTYKSMATFVAKQHKYKIISNDEYPLGVVKNGDGTLLIELNPAIPVQRRPTILIWEMANAYQRNTFAEVTNRAIEGKIKSAKEYGLRMEMVEYESHRLHLNVMNDLAENGHEIDGDFLFFLNPALDSLGQYEIPSAHNYLDAQDAGKHLAHYEKWYYKITGKKNTGKQPPTGKSKVDSPYNLNDTKYYTPVKPEKDVGGLKIAGKNDSETIRNLKKINGMCIKKLEESMRPGFSSGAGFLGKDESLIEIMVEDNDYVTSRGLTHRDLSIPLLQISNRAKRMLAQGSRIVEFEHAGIKWKVEMTPYRGFQESPFNDGTKTNFDFVITNLDNKQKLEYSELIPIMVERYGFYEGKGIKYRVEPAEIIRVLGLKVKSSRDN